MGELTLREVTRENWRMALLLAVYPEQQRFVANYAPIAALVLAKAYIRPGGLLWVPYAFYVGGDMVGFVALAYEPGSVGDYWIRHFFIDQRYQGQGFGKEALRVFLQFIKEQHAQCQSVQLTVHPENERVQHLYTSVGFQPTGEEVDGEPVYRLTLRS